MEFFIEEMGVITKRSVQIFIGVSGRFLMLFIDDAMLGHLGTN